MKLACCTALAIALLVLAPATSSAATTIGSSIPAYDEEAIECTHPGGCTFVARTIAGTPVVVPHDGILTSWTVVLPSSADTGPVDLVVLRPSGAGAAKVGGTTIGPSATDGSQNGMTTQIPVKAGDRIGVELDLGDEVGIYSHSDFDSDSWWFEPRLSSARAPDLAEVDDFQALFSATIQRDTDGNGEGDDNQRFCERPRGCSTRPSVTASIDQRIVFTGARVRLHATILGPGLRAPSDAVFAVRFAPQLAALSATGRGPCAISATEVSCALGKIAVAERIDINVEFEARSPGVTLVAPELRVWGFRVFPRGISEVRVLATGACANLTGFGTIGGDRLTGDGRANTIGGLAGDDCLAGGPGGDTLNGGDGHDRLEGGNGRDLLKGDEGDDRLNGGPWSDRLYAGAGNDRVDDVDRKRDTVRCGAGRDRARVDKVDSVSGCESVKRLSPPMKGPAKKKRPANKKRRR